MVAGVHYVPPRRVLLTFSVPAPKSYMLPIDEGEGGQATDRASPADLNVRVVPLHDYFHPP